MSNNILYIEDNPDNMRLVQRALESRGYHLLQAKNGLIGRANGGKRTSGLDPAGYQPARY